MGMPRILPGHAENVRNCNDANLGFCTCFPSKNNMKCMHKISTQVVRVLHTVESRLTATSVIRSPIYYDIRTLFSAIHLCIQKNVNTAKGRV